MSNLIQIIDRTGDKKNTALPSALPAELQSPALGEALSVEDVQSRLGGKTGRAYWRSLEELAGDPKFERLLQREFPNQAPRDMAPLPRRDFLKLMGASLALAGLTGCAFQPQEEIVSQVKGNADQIPSIPQFYATAMHLNGSAIGLLAESNNGRPTKIEGNPSHPSSLGATDVWAQASILNLYDPERAQQIRKLGNNASWEDFTGAMNAALKALRPNGGAGFHLLTETVTSPSLANQIRNLQRALPNMVWHQYEPVTRDGARLGAQAAFGAPTHIVYRFDRADRVLSLDADFLLEEPGHVRYARDFADRRRARKTMDADMNRLYVIESTPTITGAMADNRLPAKASRVRNLALAVAAKMGVGGASAPAGVTPAEQKFIDEVVRDLQSVPRGRSLIIAGSHQPAEVHILAHAMNAALGNLNVTLTGHEPIEAQPIDQLASMRDLADSLKKREVKVLMMLGGNPAFNAPADLGFAEALQQQVLDTKSPIVAMHLSDHDDETSAISTWHLPMCHFLEAWGDVRGHDGTVSIQQPLIQPLYESCKSPQEILGIFDVDSTRSNLQIVQQYWQAQKPANFEKQWITWIHDGVVPGTAAAARTLAFQGTLPAAGGEVQGTEIVFRPDPSIWDGRYANNGWLQEVPKPLIKTVWDNAALMSFATSQTLGVSDDDLVDVRTESGLKQMPVVIVPGHADDSITVHMGYGRERAGQVAAGAGFNVFPLRTSRGMSFGQAKQLRASGSSYKVVRTSHHNLIDPVEKTVDGVHERPLVQTATFEQFKKNAAFVLEETQKSLPVIGLGLEEAAGHGEHAAEGHGEGEHGAEKEKDFPSLYPKTRDTVIGNEEISYAWGMSVDTSTCIGCNACVIACQSENNSAITGKQQVGMGRELHWIRIDTYFHGDVASPEVYFAPVMCMHCEKAPCEPVCPVVATQHSPEGINEMVYNRCIGTRYCSNNCPYKVRRFNYLQYSDQDTPQIQLMQNPDVTVRSRGVMEKCTYCIQRVNEGRIQAEKEERLLKDGEVVTACQQACPTNAIIFGDIRNEKSLVSQLKREPHNYGMLTELNTFPRTTYLAKVNNPNPALRNEKNEADTEKLKPADHVEKEGEASHTPETSNPTH
jgi:molybdopterin-containing oxidoreductase family iron-sulfur binding subunit